MNQNSNIIRNQRTIITRTHRSRQPKITEIQLTNKQKAAQDIWEIICMILKRKFLGGIQQIQNYNFNANRKSFVSENLQRGYRVKSQDNSRLKPRSRALDPYAEYSRARLLKDIIEKLKAKRNIHHVKTQSQSINISQRIHHLQRIFQESAPKDSSSYDGDEINNAKLYELMEEIAKLKRQLAERDKRQAQNHYSESISNISRQSRANHSMTEEQKSYNFHKKNEQEQEKKFLQNEKCNQSETLPFHKHSARESEFVLPQDSKKTEESKNTQKFNRRFPPRPTDSSPSRAASFHETPYPIQHKYSEPHFRNIYQEQKPNSSREQNRGYTEYPAPIYNITQNPVYIHQNPVTINHHTVTNIHQAPFVERNGMKPPQQFQTKREVRSSSFSRPASSSEKQIYTFNAYPNKVVTEVKHTFNQPKVTELKQPFRPPRPQVSTKRNQQPQQPQHTPNQTTKFYSPQPVHFVQKKPFKLLTEATQKEQQKMNKSKKLSIMSTRDKKSPIHLHDGYCGECGRRYD